MNQLNEAPDNAWKNRVTAKFGKGVKFSDETGEENQDSTPAHIHAYDLEGKKVGSFSRVTKKELTEMSGETYKRYSELATKAGPDRAYKKEVQISRDLYDGNKEKISNKIKKLNRIKSGVNVDKAKQKIEMKSDTVSEELLSETPKGDLEQTEKDFSEHGASVPNTPKKRVIKLMKPDGKVHSVHDSFKSANDARNKISGATPKTHPIVVEDTELEQIQKQHLIETGEFISLSKISDMIQETKYTDGQKMTGKPISTASKATLTHGNPHKATLTAAIVKILAGK